MPGEETIFTRSVESALRTSDYFRITGVMSEKDAENALKSGDVSFVINIPTDFTRRLLRGGLFAGRHADEAARLQAEGRGDLRRLVREKFGDAAGEAACSSTLNQ